MTATSKNQKRVTTTARVRDQQTDRGNTLSVLSEDQESLRNSNRRKKEMRKAQYCQLTLLAPQEE